MFTMSLSSVVSREESADLVFQGRFGPRGKYYQAESQFHAARTMLGHYHYICRGTSLLNAPEKSLVEFGLTDEEKAYIACAKKQTKSQGRSV